MSAPLRIGILGAARIAPLAIIKPAREIPEVQIVAVAARDPARAEAFARKHGIPRALSSYQELLADDQVDAIYNPLPNNLHCEWSIRALEAGKHVLCEKPIAANAAEAEQMRDAAARTGKLLIEAMHYRYHPLAAHIREIVHSGVLGKLRHVESWACVPLLRRDFRWQYEMAGGALMDLGVYAINTQRLVTGAEPEVVSAQARVASPNVDRWLSAELRYPDGCAGKFTCSMWSTDLLKGEIIARGENGTLRVGNPNAPHLFHFVRLKIGDQTTQTKLKGLKTTYYYQLKAFAAGAQGGPRPETDAEDAVKNMRVIDAAYRAAGLAIRGAQPAASR